MVQKGLVVMANGVARSVWAAWVGRLGAVLGPFLGLVLICALFAMLPASGPRFVSADNWRLIAVQTVILGTVALGATLVIVAGGIDLSVGSAVALITVGIVQFQRQLGWSLPLALVGGVALGGLCGLANGLLVTGLRVVPFIITLGTLKVFRGLAKWWAGNLSIYAFDRSRPEPEWLKRTLSVNLRPPAWLAESARDPIGAVLAELTRVAPGVWSLLGLSLLVALLLRYSLLGRYLYAVGSNEATARLCGVRVERVKLAVYALAGLLTGVAGVMQFAYFHGTGDPTSGEGLELKAIASVVIGGGSLSGGEGTVLGTLVGCLIIQVLENGCTHAGIPNAIQDILIGAIIIVAVAIDQIRRRGLHGPTRWFLTIATRLGRRPPVRGGEAGS
ncbi:MAG: ribonucleotide-diphosphate reductase subunit alpha [Isosphaeraceae bacterium]|jgi:ribose/xylose/arabinose/galactoside ABC-type transport system permease subunit|nr:MAG: ribonucleotide-diphosphate reductase subunit alpha [Isosphaeraceae bacterium]